MRDRRSAIVVLVAIGTALALLATSCGFATDTSAEQVTDTSALLRGRVRNTIAAPTTYWFEYGETDSYGATTPEGTVAAGPTEMPEVEQPVTGLTPGTDYHFRLCAKGPDGGVCSYDATFTTVAGPDSVTGAGTVFAWPEAGYGIGATITARSLPDGSSPTGSASVSPSVAYHKWSDSGPVTCLRVEGNRATVGILAQAPDVEGQESSPYHRLIFIEDNGSSGDRYGTRVVADATSCPAATDNDFPPFVLSGYLIPPLVTSGDFVVHDQGA